MNGIDGGPLIVPVVPSFRNLSTLQKCLYTYTYIRNLSINSLFFVPFLQTVSSYKDRTEQQGSDLQKRTTLQLCRNFVLYANHSPAAPAHRVMPTLISVFSVGRRPTFLIKMRIFYFMYFFAMYAFAHKLVPPASFHLK